MNLVLIASALAQPSVGPKVSLRTGTKPKLIARFDNDTLYLRAWDTRGEPITTLDSSDLLITIGNDTADIIRFEPVRTLSAEDLAISFVLDNSGSMFHAYDSLTNYLDRFLDSLGAGAILSAMTFDNTDRDPTYDATGRQQLFLASRPFTTERARISDFWHFYDSIRSGYTPLFDAMWKSFEHIAERRRSGDSLRSDVLVVVTDGEDNCSTISGNHLAELAAAMHVSIYVVNFRSDPQWRMIWLVNHAGGRTFTAETLGGLRSVLAGIRRSLVSGYRVVFGLPFSGAGGFRRY
ncbi:MAG: VWA domain-containing protein [Bacteroidetes bacterium]|nr:VWA domain-containing protein [Bacteroidota bacterium]